MGGSRALGSWQGRAAGVTVLQLGRPDPRSAGERPPRSPGSALHPGGLCWAQAVPGGLPICGGCPRLPRRGWSRSRTLSRGPALRRRARGRVREGRLAFATSKGGGGGDRRRSAGREGVFCCQHTRPTPDPLVSPERCLEGRAGRRVIAGTEGTGVTPIPVSRRAGLGARLAPQHLPPYRRGGSPRLKASQPGCCGHVPSWVAGAGPSSPHPTGAGARLPLRGGLPPSVPCPTKLRVPPPTRCSLPAGLWAPTSTRNGGCPGRYRRPSRCQAGGEPALLGLARAGAGAPSGPGAEQAGAEAGAAGRGVP